MEVLVVDDQEPFRSVARTLLSLTPGLDLLAEAESGEDAVRLATALHPPAILMDINLPGISGIEATRLIHAADPSVRVVLMSTYAAVDLPTDALDSGAIGYLRKEDITPDRLLQLLTAGDTEPSP